ncbi:MOSC N-terminal beta barrel domain-containing protein [Amycolatopsis sp. NBC_00345]|uniref:MOSC domain-containing protein n=1 Tax=Amycolatopsis sp. NBC_00345 TaxID=2975955 RepID=UPI002E273B12
MTATTEVLMNTEQPVGSVAELWRFPVKSMLGERLDTVELTGTGIAGDRAYAIFDPATGKVASAKHPRLWPDMFGCRATFVAPPRPGEPPPPARIELADGTVVRTDAPGADDVLSRFFGREVRLISASPEKYLIDEYHPDLEHLNPQGDRDVVVDQPLGAALFGALGRPSVVPPGALVDLFPLSVLATSSLRRFAELEPDGEWDTRRFRMNVIVETPGTTFADNAWVGGNLAFGTGAALDVAVPTPRCVMTNLALDELPRNPRMLKAAAAHNRLDILGLGLYPCAGVYAVPTAPGPIHIGDQVRLTSGGRTPGTDRELTPDEAPS